jgi:hypothetical protein
VAFAIRKEALVLLVVKEVPSYNLSLFYNPKIMI